MAELVRRPRVIIADDHRLFLAGLAKLLRKHCDIVAEIDDSSALIETIGTIQSDLVLLDISMPGRNGIELAQEIRELFPATKIIFVSVHDEASFLEAALAAGASGYVLKSSAPEELIQAIEQVARGRTYVSHAMDHSGNDVHFSQEPLTPRQKEVLQLLASGLSTKEIADRLFVTTKAIDFHRGRIRAALGLRTTAQLTRYAIVNGLVDL